MASTVIVNNPKCRRTSTAIQGRAWLFATLVLMNLTVTTLAQEIGELYAFRKGHLIEYHVLSRATEHDLRHAVTKITQVAFPCKAQRWQLEHPELEHFWAHLYETCDPLANTTMSTPSELVDVSDHFVDLHDPVYNFYRHGEVWPHGDTNNADEFYDDYWQAPPVKIMPLPSSVVRQVDLPPNAKVAPGEQNSVHNLERLRSHMDDVRDRHIYGIRSGAHNLGQAFARSDSHRKVSHVCPKRLQTFPDHSSWMNKTMLHYLNATTLTLPFGSGDGSVANWTVHKLLDDFKMQLEDAEPYALIDLFYIPIHCDSPCGFHGLMFTSPGCAAETVCNFEGNRNNSNCQWSYTTSSEIRRLIHESRMENKVRKLGTQDFVVGRPFAGPLDHFNTVVSGDGNISNHYAFYSARQPTENVAMIVSPYYQHTSATCELIFKHRVLGEVGSELVISTEQISHSAIADDEISEAEDDDWIRPTLRATFLPQSVKDEPFTTSRVPIGQIVFPTRVRIECHTSEQASNAASDINVECHVDDIRLVNCEEELWRADMCQGNQTRKYLCNRYNEQRCINYFDICDMHAECPGDEDEDNRFHNCSLVPPGARCNFEDTSLETGCPNWSFFTSGQQRNNGTMKHNLVRLANTTRYNRYQTHTGLPPPEYKYHGRTYKPGHFLFFSTYGTSSDKDAHLTEVQYTYAMSPLFPPTSLETSLPFKEKYRTCVVHFFYCHSGMSTFQLMIESRDRTRKHVLWTPPQGTGSEPCEWQKASALIPHQPTEYFLKIAFAKLYKQPVSVAIDDFTLTPNCFLEMNVWKTRFLPQHAEVTTCNISGPIPPAGEFCTWEGNAEKDKSKLASSSDIQFTTHRTWLVPHKNQYRIELHGAAGGKFPHQKTNNNGGLVVMNVELASQQEVVFMIGQQGLSPCDHSEHHKTALLSSAQKNRLLLCKDSLSESETNVLRKDAHNLPGTAGGGATAMFLGNRVVAVAGGGGGVVPGFLALNPDDRSIAVGGQSVKPTSEPKVSTLWMSGYGASLQDFAADSTPPWSNSCPECDVMNGVVPLRNFSRAGECPKGRAWNISGGYGGGGASCGPGGGGGAGYRGGTPGLKGHGGGGSSFLASTNLPHIMQAGFNGVNGRVVIRACSLDCSVNATCVFEAPELGKEPVMYCLCDNGRKVGAKTSCVTGVGPGNDLTAMIGRLATDYDTLKALALALIGLIFLFLVCCIICLYRGRNTKKDPGFLGCHQEMHVIASDTPRCSGNKISGNPIYEMLTISELPQISRHFLQMEKIIGHGAFGEVYEGYIKFDNGPSTKVAIKTLPPESGPEIQEDFETEARLLSRFKHDNIVKFHGVSFEQLPKLIILELLEGGDLKSFLRESRPKQNASPDDEPTAIRMIDLVEMALDVARGCAYLETTRFVHRDIAARNCLLTTKGPDRMVKIADFGMARDIFRKSCPTDYYSTIEDLGLGASWYSSVTENQTNDYYRKGGKAFLPVKWMPPEAFLDGIFTSKTDCWAYGVLLWEIFSLGYVPYTGRPNHEVMQLIVAGDRLDPPIGVPEEIYAQMLKCWNTDAEARPTFKEIVAFLTALAHDPKIREAPLPPIRYRLTQNSESGTPSQTPSSARSAHGDMDPCPSSMSQATDSTMLNSMTESTSASCDSMPTTGEGVSHNVFPPYESRLPNPLMDMKASTTSAAESGGSMSSHDDESTLHDTNSVKLSPYKIDHNADYGQLRPFQGQPPGSRRPIIVKENEAGPPVAPPRPSKLFDAFKRARMDSSSTPLVPSTPPPKPPLHLDSPSTPSTVSTAYSATKRSPTIRYQPKVLKVPPPAPPGRDSASGSGDPARHRLLADQSPSSPLYNPSQVV